MVVIDPLRTITAEAADVFIQPLPGTDVALMLALMHILIRDELLDVDYITQYTEGFEELKEQVSMWTPVRAAEICGITVEVIESLAHDYGTIKRAFIRTLIGAEHREHGVMFFRTLTCLPMLTGAWRHKGGGFSRSVGSYAATNIDDSVFDIPSLNAGKERRSLSMNHLGRVLNDATLAPPVKMLFVYNGNPLVTAPNAELIRRGFEREDLFTVVSEQFMTDTAKYADVISRHVPKLNNWMWFPHGAISIWDGIIKQFSHWAKALLTLNFGVDSQLRVVLLSLNFLKTTSRCWSARFMILMLKG